MGEKQYMEKKERKSSVNTAQLATHDNAITGGARKPPAAMGCLTML